jgi:hypothetical protein
MVLYPTAAIITATSVVLMTWIFSAIICAIWPTPSPYYVFGNHLLPLSIVGLIFAILLGFFVARAALRKVEFRLHEHPTYYGVRHLWRVAAASLLAATAITPAQGQGGVAVSFWVSLCVAAIALALHFALWEGAFYSLRKRLQT